MFADVSLKGLEEVVHNLGVSLSNLAVLSVVRAVGSLDIVEDSKALVETLVKHHVVDRLLHLVYLGSEVILLLHGQIVVVVAALSQLYMKLLLGLL